MRKIIFSIITLATISVNAQNVLPTNGDVGIGTTNPSAKLDVNGRTIIDSTLIVKDSVRFKDRLIVDKKVIFKADSKTKGNARVEGNIKGDHKLTIDGTAKFNGVVKMTNLGGVNNMNNPNLEFLIKKPNGEVVSINRGQLVNAVYANQVECIEDVNGNPVTIPIASPIWNNGVNKIYSYYQCGDVNVGINTPNPQFQLDVRGTTYTVKLKAGSKTATDNAVINAFSPNNTQDIVNFGVNIGQSGQQSQVLFKITNNGTVIIKSRNQYHPLMVYNTAGSKILQLDNSGILRAREIKVDLETWPDYVFDINYKLMSLEMVAKYIKIYKHLPGVPTAKEIEEKGLGIGKMQTIQMEKIEELTLYTIQQDEKITNLENTVQNLQQQLDDIKAMLK